MSEGRPEACRSPSDDAITVSGVIRSDGTRVWKLEGHWAMTEAALKYKRSDASAFVVEHESSENGRAPPPLANVSVPPPDGRYSGSFTDFSRSGKRPIKDTSNLSFTANSAGGWNLIGKAQNEFGRFDVTGACKPDGDGIKVIMWRMPAEKAAARAAPVEPEKSAQKGAPDSQKSKRKERSSSSGRFSKAAKTDSRQAGGGSANGARADSNDGGGKQGPLVDNHHRHEASSPVADQNAARNEPSVNGSAPPHTTKPAAAQTSMPSRQRVLEQAQHENVGNSSRSPSVSSSVEGRGSGMKAPVSVKKEPKSDSSVGGSSAVVSHGAERTIGLDKGKGKETALQQEVGGSSAAGHKALEGRLFELMELEAQYASRVSALEFWKSKVPKASKEVADLTEEKNFYEGEAKLDVDRRVQDMEREVEAVKCALRTAVDAYTRDSANYRLKYAAKMAEIDVKGAEAKLIDAKKKVAWLKGEAQVACAAIAPKAAFLEHVKEKIEQARIDVEAAEALVKQAKS